MTELLKTIKGRKSVRTFDGRPVSAEDREKLEQYIATITNPFGIPVRFVLLDAKEHGLSSPVLSGETLYAAGIVPKLPNADTAFGYAFEKLVLYAWSLGIGTTWIGGTMKRDVFERAAGLGEGEMMPCVSPLGYPAKKRSIKETVMRKGVGADTRLPAEKIFFDGEWDKPLPAEKQAAIGDLAEMVRWAPSAVNKQPWRAVVCGERVHFYEKRSRGYVSDNGWDLQKIDMGIALCHFELAAKDCGFTAAFEISTPEIPVRDNLQYIASYVLK